MKILFAFLSLIISMSCSAQTSIKLEEVKNHIGDSVEVKGKVYGISYFENAKDSPTLINVGAKYPDQILTIVIFGNVRKQLSFNLQDEKFASGLVVADGKIELYKGKPQIVIRDINQLKFIIDEEVH